MTMPPAALPPMRVRSARRSPMRSSIPLLRLRHHPELLDAGAIHDVEHCNNASVRHRFVGFEQRFADLVASYEAFARLDLGHFDVVISGKYPAWMVRHPRHLVYMLHRLRGLYDTYPAGMPTQAVWHEEDDTIYRVPFSSLAHAVGLDELSTRHPAALLPEADPYATALDDTARPKLAVTWSGPGPNATTPAGDRPSQPHRAQPQSGAHR